MRSFGRCRYRVSPILPLSQQLYSRDFDFHNFSSPDLLKSRMIRWTAKLIIGFDFAVTLSSPESCCTLFAIASEQTVELIWLMLNKHKRWFHSSRVKFPLVTMSASWFLVSMYLIWIFGVQIDSIETTNQQQLCGFLKHVSLSGVFP